MSSTQISVIESNKATQVITLVNAGTLKSRLTKLNQNSKASTLSLAFYTMVHGNVAPLGSCDKSIANLLDRTYRQFVCAKFNDTTGKWDYNKARSTVLLKDLGLTFKVSTFAEFVDAIEAHESTLAAKKAAKEEESSALNPEETLAKDKERVQKYLLNCGLTTLQLKDIVLQLEKERSKADAKSIRLVTAAAK